MTFPGTETEAVNSDHGKIKTEEDESGGVERQQEDQAGESENAAVAADDEAAQLAVRNLCHNTQQLTDAYERASMKRDLERKRVSELRSALEEARAMISKREGQVISAKQKALAANEQVQQLTGERDHERAGAGRKAEEIEALREEIERLTTENREFKKVSRVVALENHNSRLAEENERLSKALFTKAQKQQSLQSQQQQQQQAQAHNT